MRFLLPRKHRRPSHDGFTLIEVLIIAPVVIIVISSFVALMITIIGDVLITRDQSAMSFEVQDSLDRIEQDTRLSTQFLATSNTLPSPQGSDSNFTGTAAFSSTNSLILGNLTTDKNPTDTTRQLVFYAKQPNDCGTLQSYNRPFIGKTIYFIKNNSLWRRTFLFPYNTNPTPNDETLCSTPWQQNSCSPGYVSTRCQTNDVEVMRNVTSFNVKYFANPSSTTDIGAANALNATTIEVTLNGTKTVAGRTITNSGSLRVSKLNNIDADLPVPATPTVSAQTTNANGANFTWPAVPSATSYLISYNINGGAWTDTTNNSTTLNYIVNANRKDTVTIRVAARNSTGTSAYTTIAFTIPDWNTCDLQNGWVNYGGDYTTAGFTKTSAEIVQLKGLIKNGNTAVGTVLCYLPPGFRPTATIMFQVANSSSSNTSRIDIQPSGAVNLGDTTANAGWLNLSDIRFVASTASYTPVTMPFQNGWVNLDPAGGWSHLQLRKDSLNRVHVQGTIKDGAMTDGTAIINLPAGYQPTEYYHIPVRSNAGFNLVGVYTPNLQYKNINSPGVNAFYAPQVMFYNGSTASWPSLTLQNGWSAYTPLGGLYTYPQYTKASDGLVTVKGLIRNGTATGTPTLAQLPVGYRPKERVLLQVASCGAFGRVDIDPNGSIIFVNGTNCWFALDSISFMAEQ